MFGSGIRKDTRKEFTGKRIGNVIGLDDNLGGGDRELRDENGDQALLLDPLLQENMTSLKSRKSNWTEMRRAASTDGDIVIHCEDKRPRAHKLILWARSPVFRTMSRSDRVEASKFIDPGPTKIF